MMTWPNNVIVSAIKRNIPVFTAIKLLILKQLLSENYTDIFINVDNITLNFKYGWHIFIYLALIVIEVEIATPS